VLWDGDPRTSELCGGAYRLPAASTLVSARLGINGALSLRHLCLWTFLLSGNLLLLSRGLPVSASVNPCRTPGLSQAISASWLVVVKDAVGVLSLALQRRGLFMLKEVGGRRLGASSSQQCPIDLKIRARRTVGSSAYLASRLGDCVFADRASERPCAIN
jgi:hypothetical protein